MKLLWSRITHTINQFFASLGHFFSAKHFAATWILLAIIILGLAYSIFKYRTFWVTHWRRIILTTGAVLLLILVLMIPKIQYWYDTRIVLPKTLSVQEKQQYLDEWHSIINNTDQGKNHSLMYNDIGILRGSLKDYKGAVRAFKVAISRNPEDARFYRNLAITYTNMDDYQSAEAAFQQAFKTAPTQPEYWLELGELYIYKIQNNDKAKLFYLEALSRTNNDISVAQAYAQFLENIVKDYPEAIKYWQIVLDGVDSSKKASFSQHISELKQKAGIK